MADVPRRHRLRRQDEERDELFEEFIERRRMETMQRRLRGYRVLAAMLGAGCVLLVAATAILALRLSLTTTGPVASRAEQPLPPAPPVASVPAPVRDPAASPATSEALPAESERDAPGEPSPAPAPARTVRPAPAPVPEPTAPPPPTPGSAAEAPVDSAQRMAAWMVETYGRRAAAERAGRAAGFYDPGTPNAVFWGRVLNEIRTASGG